MLMLNIKALHKLASVCCLAPTNHPASVCPSLGRSASAAAERRRRLVTRQGHRTILGTWTRWRWTLPRPPWTPGGSAREYPVLADLVITFLPALRSPYGVYEGSEYQYPVVLNQTNKVASFINIEDMLFEVITWKYLSASHTCWVSPI